MLFNSIHFLVFFPIVVLIYFLMPFKFRKVWMLISSYYFYMSWNPKYAILIGTTTIITYFSGLLIEKANGISDGDKSIKLKKFWVLMSIVSNLGILFLFKYYNFFISSIKRVLSLNDVIVIISSFDYLLPVGISFYTFQALSYTMDIYRKDVKAEKSMVKYALFVSFFPQVLAGPIEKSKNLLHQFDEKHSFDYYRVRNGLVLMLWGFFQKIVIADRLAILVNTVYNNPSKYRGLEIIIATIFYAFQIYCDFSSYSDIARGAAEIMGFRLTVNFKQPYFSRSIKEFWKRWHISLSSWFKDYLYIPLGGNRCSKLRNYANIMIVFLVSGLWHGASMNFLVWGGLHGIYQVIENILKPVKEKIIDAFKIKTDIFSFKFFQVLTNFVLVDFAWIFFRANSFTGAKMLIKNMAYFNPWILYSGEIYSLGLDSKDFKVAVLGIIIVLIVNYIQATESVHIDLSKQNIGFRWAVYFTAIIFILILGVYGPEYSKQQFIYFQF
ncbi:MBOAT family O-acyltransferase [Clostridium sp. HMP27]|uniref:MBOAT family O-acyltransferase n=1 Tax=Clostridium sp. HMP27 TaxID=1487921 RepID=UPI00052C793A|nr:MBOAT family O-acyltransferase [Clostridium sp. HMP27]KGK81730.1 alginate O-acetyltransferase [Clostridium sp. HMP27]